MANKERYSVAQIVAALDHTRGMKARAAKRLGCHHSTITNYAKRHSTVAAALSQNREEMTDTAELALYDAVERGEAWAVCFYLKTQGKERGYIERSEVSGPDGGPVPITRVEVVSANGSEANGAGEAAGLVRGNS